MSTFDIVASCPEIIIPALPLPRPAAAAPGYEYPRATHLLSNLHLTFISVPPPNPLTLSLSLSSFSFIYLAISRLSFSHQPTTLPLHPSIQPAILCFSCASDSLFFPSSLFSAKPAAATMPVSLIYFSPTPYSLPLVLYPPMCLYAISLSLPFVNLFLPSTPLKASVSPQCCIAFLFTRVALFLHRTCPSFLYPPFPFPRSDARQSQGVNSSFIRSL